MNRWEVVSGDAIIWLQWRLVALLRQHDNALLGDSAAPWRRMAALTSAADTLLDDLMPRVVRHLSAAASHTRGHELLPTRGRVDWPRTLAANWRTLPDHPPLSVVAQRRGQAFDTPANRLAVSALLDVRAALTRELTWIVPDQRHALLRQPLVRHVERCDRVLALPPFAGLVQRDGRVRHADIESTQHPPGLPRAYEPLLPWRAAFARLATLGAQPPLNAGRLGDADRAHVDELYRWWLFYETIDLATHQGAGLEWRPAHHEALLRWPGPRCCRLRRGAALDAPWQRAPAVVPDLHLEVQHASHPRPHELMLVVQWLPPDHPDQGGMPAAKRLLADLVFGDRRHGAIVYGMTADAADHSPYHIAPIAGGLAHHPAAPPLDVWCVPPRDPQRAASAIAALLEAAFAPLEIPPPACHGVFLDALSVAERGATVGLHGDDLLLCPKPHLGIGRMDVVSRSRHCCRDAARCHIVGQRDARPPLRSPRTTSDLLAEVRSLLVDGDPAELDDALVEHVTSAVVDVTRRFAHITGVLQDLGRFDARIVDVGLGPSAGLLDASGRESLALAIYIRDQLDDIRALDYSAAIIHVTRVIEHELARRIERLASWGGAWQRTPFVTIGSLSGVRRRWPDIWQTIRDEIAGQWRGHIDRADPAYCADIETFVDELLVIARFRNRAAHTTPVLRDDFRDAMRRIGGGAGALRMGVLNTLLLAWPG